jgi:hypothetical protein
VKQASRAEMAMSEGNLRLHALTTPVRVTKALPSKFKVIFANFTTNN